MLRNYLTIAIRNMLRHKLYSFINIGGLTIGLAACLLIYLFVQNELSYDKWIPESERIVRLEGTLHQPGQLPNLMVLSPGPLAPPMAEAFPSAIEAATRMLQEGFLVRHGDTKFIESAWLVDAGFFDVFDFPILEGDRSAAFKDYKSIIISERMAKKYFGEASPIGEIVSLDNDNMLVKVVAVMKNLPENTHFDIDILLHYDTSRYEAMPWINQWWLSSNVYTYFKLTDISQTAYLLQNFPAWYDENAVPGPALAGGGKASEALTFEYMPLQDIHLYSSGRFQLKDTGDIVVIYSFTAIAILILGIAIINFTNLSTARASLRAKEIALRKTVGASRRQLISQFLGEAILTTTIALMLAFVIVEISLPWFNDFVSKLLNFGSFADPSVQLGLIALVAVIGLGAGAHPAFKLSSYRPASVLHSQNTALSGSAKLRSVLTTLQFTISIGLMITTAVVYSQLQFAQDIESGFEKDNRLYIQNMAFGPVAEVAETIRQEIESLPGVRETAFSQRNLPLRGYWDFPVTLPNATEDTQLKLEQVPGDFNMLEFFDAELIAGRFFSPERRTDLRLEATSEGGQATDASILNETAVRYMGFQSAEDALGKTILVANADGSFLASTVVGVVKDMHLRSLRDTVDATMYSVHKRTAYLNVLIDPAQQAETMREIEVIWNKLAPAVPLSSTFLTDSFRDFYQVDQQRAEMFAYFSLFAILVSCLGLYGLASFTAERRVKEIGVRKIMGARVRDIVKLLTFQFSKPVLLANLIAWPISWYFADQWLAGFVYRIDLSPVYFVVAGTVALAIAVLTVAGHAFKTAIANPIAALRHE